MLAPNEQSQENRNSPGESTPQRVERKLGRERTRAEAHQAQRRRANWMTLFVALSLVLLWFRYASLVRAVIAVIVSFSSLVFVLHNLILLPFGVWYRRHKVRPLRDFTPSRFAILVPAHNEERVVGALVHNLLDLDYPADSFGVYVIADNCTDATAAEARAAGAIVYERQDSDHQTKAHALRWMIENLAEAGEDWDAVVVIDSDNLVDSRFLLHMNRRLKDGERLLQGYLDVKNPFDSWISSSVAIGYWSTNRLWQLPKYRLGLSAALGGTGMCIDWKLLRHLGWSTASFTEDLDFQCRALLTGVRTAWVHEARIYDEKPNDMRASMRQRERWMIGHNACRREYFWPLLKRGLTRPDPASLDAALYLLYPALAPAWLLLIALTLLAAGPTRFAALWGPGLNPLAWLAVLVVGAYGFPLVGLLAGDVPHRIYRALWYYPIYCLTWIPVVLLSFLRRQRTWAHTQHVRQLALNDVLQQRVNEGD